MKKILIVDDIPENIELLMNLLSNNYQLFAATNGVKALKIIHSNDIDLVLLDIVMPEMDGYEVCQRIKSISGVSHIPVIFVSSLDTMEDRVKGFESGADDYQTKPINKEELLSKIYHNLLKSDERTNQNKEMENTTAVAVNAVAMSNELGLVSRYLLQLPGIRSFKDLSSFILEFIEGFGLEGILKINTNTSKPLYESNYQCSEEMVKHVFDKAENIAAQYHYHQKSIFKYRSITLLINNMPIKNKEFYGRLKEIIAMVVDGSNFTVDALKSELQRQLLVKDLQKQNNKLHQLMQTVEKMIELSEKEHHQAILEKAKIMSEHIEILHDSFLHLGLSDNQENKLISQSLETDEKMQKIFDKSKEYEERFNMLKALIRL